jgi:hypothetical protein
MLIVGQTLVSEDILEAHFACQLHQCKGECCVQGDVGAPLAEEEIPLIKADLPGMMNVLPENSRDLLSGQEFWERDSDGEAVIRCHPDGACVFAIRENGITLCGMEQAWRQELTAFRKPLSCHLYPIRCHEYGEFTVMNYHRWEICGSACAAGMAQQIPLFRFLKDALIRKMGPAWYEELEAIAAARASGSGI